MTTESHSFSGEVSNDQTAPSAIERAARHSLWILKRNKSRSAEALKQYQPQFVAGLMRDVDAVEAQQLTRRER